MNYQHHYDARGLVFKVKAHNLGDIDGATDKQRERAWNITAPIWWEDATQLAKKNGFEDLFSCGRSGGYAYPVNVNARAYTQDDLDDSADLSARFNALGEALGEHLKAAPSLYIDQLQQIMDEDVEQKVLDDRAEAMPGLLADALRKMIERAEQEVNSLWSLGEDDDDTKIEAENAQVELDAARAVLKEYEAIR